ncbi:MAG TPA: lipid-A-disaccharide synthase [Rhizomicrobium sp.]|nr:lipid-A-disaccharide synthase [Rhizomicrobium sp.]
MSGKPLTLMLVCGEPSGDELGAQLMARLRELAGDSVRIIGVGGPAMAARGLDSLYPLDATAVMGLREVVPRIPEILRRVKRAVDFAIAERPDAVVCIDSPDFTHRIARALKRRDPAIRTVNYVAPQVWASRQYRARKMARYFDLVLALFPFEVAFFDRYRLKAKFAGHPVIERAALMAGGGALRARLGIAPDAPLLCVLPGSRASEVRFLMPVFRDAVAKIAVEVPGLRCVLPTVPNVASKVRAALADWSVPVDVLEGDADKYAALSTAEVALAASGTVTTELALAHTPMVVAYKLGWLTYALMRPLITVKHATLANILLERRAIPEFIQFACQPGPIADAVIHLFQSPQARAAQVEDLKRAAALLGEGAEPPSLRAARALLDFARG